MRAITFTMLALYDCKSDAVTGQLLKSLLDELTKSSGQRDFAYVIMGKGDYDQLIQSLTEANDRMR